MNCDNAQYMLAIFSTGFACGMQHRYECYYNYQRMLGMYSSYDKTLFNIEEMWNKILEFEKGLASCSEEEELLKSYTVEALIKDIEEWYAQPRKKMG